MFINFIQMCFVLNQVFRVVPETSGVMFFLKKTLAECLELLYNPNIQEAEVRGLIKFKVSIRLALGYRVRPCLIK